MWLYPPQTLVVDIETSNGDPIEAEEWMRRCWTPSPSWKPMTIGSRYFKMLERKEERLALLDTSPIVSVAMKTESDCRVLHWMDFADSSIAGVPLERFDDERAMLERVGQYLGTCSPETTIIGHNIVRFDLPRIRRAMLSHGVQLPACLLWRGQPTFDSMIEWRAFTVDDRRFVGLAEVLEACGLPNHKGEIDGSQVPELHAQGRYAELLGYAALDVLSEWAVFLRMTGQQGAEVAPAAAPAPLVQTVAPPPPPAAAQRQPAAIELAPPVPSEPAGDDLEAMLAEIEGNFS